METEGHTVCIRDENEKDNETSIKSIEPVTTIRSICTANDSLEDITVLRYVDLDDYDRRTTFYEIGHESNSIAVTKKRYSEFSKFFKYIQAKAIEESLTIFEHYKFPNKSVFNTSSEFTKERRKRGFKSLLRLVIQQECLHSALLDFIGIEYEMMGDTVMVINTSEYTDMGGTPQRRHSHSSKLNVTASKVLKRVRQGYSSAIGGSFLTAEALIQGFHFNQGYVPIRNPDGPTKGVELYLNNYFLLSMCGENRSDLFRRIKDSFFADQDIPVRENESLVAVRHIRLLFVGDSLVCGVGCDNDIGPVMPKVIAQCLSLVFRADVIWSAHGINGGTAVQITGLLPKVGEDLAQNPLIEGEELIVVLMCGLNDWKTIITQFPHGSGPISFKRALRNLLVCMKNELGNNFRLFIPAMPIGCVDTDPCASLQIRPLKYFVDFVSHTWDFQKKELAAENSCGFKQSMFIPSPSKDHHRPYSTPGEGNICRDGVHPSTKGYEWFALHVFDHIVNAMRSLH